ncbi:hypothetical protein Glove_227g92 [Diversispora epigaea]|uniref:Pre-mRNA-splicing factor SYF2 n=1 Tax=Diversispora epigaea TaxID=1348612 RepID=A0A397IH09_9GLOM|nr:hypothetical protein Glove_227g92 [Diversispora epigaea]
MGDSLETESTTSGFGEVKSRIDRLQVLRKRLDEASQANRQEIYAEKQSKRINQRAEVCAERKSKIAAKLSAQKEAEERGEDYERKKYWNYSIESVENWEKKQEKVDKRKEISFTDYNQSARKKYKRLVSELTPDLEEHNRQKSSTLNSAKVDEASQANRQEIYAEKQSKRINQRAEVCAERKSKIAAKLSAQKEAEERGEDYERKKYWNYSIESVENWEKKQEKVDKRKEISFTDYNQSARKKYKRLVSELTPDLEEHNRQKSSTLNSAKVVKTKNGEKVLVDIDSSFYRDANSMHFASVDNQPSDKAVDRLVDDVNKQIERREKYSRKKSIDEDSNVTYVNERNRKFNGKVNRFFDKYTREIRENLERGTAI